MIKSISVRMYGRFYLTTRLIAVFILNHCALLPVSTTDQSFTSDSGV